MPVTIQWDNEEKTAARIEYVGKWTWAELYDMVQTSKKMLDSVDHKVDMIQIWTNAYIPANGLSHARNLMSNNHPNTGALIMVGANAFFLTLWKAFEKLYQTFISHNTFYFVGTLDEARRIRAMRHQSHSA